MGGETRVALLGNGSGYSFKHHGGHWLCVTNNHEMWAVPQPTQQPLAPAAMRATITRLLTTEPTITVPVGVLRSWSDAVPGDEQSAPGRILGVFVDCLRLSRTLEPWPDAEPVGLAAVTVGDMPALVVTHSRLRYMLAAMKVEGPGAEWLPVFSEVQA